MWGNPEDIWIPDPRLWIPDPKPWIPDSSPWIPDSKLLDSGFQSQKNFGFRIPVFGFRIPNLGFRIPLPGFRISNCWIPDSKAKKIWIPDYLTWGDLKPCIYCWNHGFIYIALVIRTLMLIIFLFLLLSQYPNIVSKFWRDNNHRIIWFWEGRQKDFGFWTHFVENTRHRKNYPLKRNDNNNHKIITIEGFSWWTPYFLNLDHFWAKQKTEQLRMRTIKLAIVSRNHTCREFASKERSPRQVSKVRDITNVYSNKHKIY